MKGKHDHESLEQELMEARQELLNAVAHELNTPLTPVLIHLRRLELTAADLDPKMQDSFQVIHRNIERLLDRVRTIIQVSQMESGRYPVNMRKVSLDQIVHEAEDDYEAVAEAAGITLTPYDDTDEYVYADPSRLKVVLENLLDNAIQFTPQGGKVAIVADPGTLTAKIRIEDTGAGFRPEEKHRLFKPFSQLDTGVPHAYHGAGLGLFIAKSIVELHGGEIDAHSEGLGMGSSFSFELHLARRNIIPVSKEEAPEHLVAFNKRIRSLV
jgi:signal transduction histidine kinase